MSRDGKLTKYSIHRNSVHITIGEVIGILRPYMRRPIVGLNSNYNYNYTFGSSALDSPTKAKHLHTCAKKYHSTTTRPISKTPELTIKKGHQSINVILKPSAPFPTR